jgi:hypothetical protein
MKLDPELKQLKKQLRRQVKVIDIQELEISEFKEKIEKIPTVKRPLSEPKAKKSKEEEEQEENKNKIIIKEEVFFTPIEIALNNFYNFRKEMKKPILESSKDALREKLIKLSNNDNDTAIEIINQSIANGWQGLFELKTNNNGTTNNTKQVSKYHN